MITFRLTRSLAALLENVAAEQTVPGNQNRLSEKAQTGPRIAIADSVHRVYLNYSWIAH